MRVWIVENVSGRGGGRVVMVTKNTSVNMPKIKDSSKSSNNTRSYPFKRPKFLTIPGKRVTKFSKKKSISDVFSYPASLNPRSVWTKISLFKRSKKKKGLSPPSGC